MPEPITMFIIGFTIGALTATFWDRIESWANNALRAIQRGIDSARYSITSAAYYLVKEGSRYLTKIAIALEDWTKDKNKYIEREDREVDVNSLPDDVKAVLLQKGNVVLMSSR